MSSRKILQIIESSETGGAETVFAELVERLDRKRFVPVVALLSDGWLRGRIEKSGIRPVMMPTATGLLDHKLLRGIRDLVREEGIDLVHSHLFTTNVYSSVACVLTGVPVVSTFHGTMDVAEGDRAKRVKWAALNCFSTRIVFVSQHLRDHFVSRRLSDPSKSIVVHNGVNTSRFRQRDAAEARRALGLPADAFVVGCVGDLRPAKDYGTALRAASLLRSAIPGLRMVIAGSTTDLLDELLVLRDSLGLEKTADFIGFCPEIERVMPAFDVYLSSSGSEGFSLTVVEAMASGLPVVATRSGGPEEIIRPGESGILVPVDSPEAIAEAITALHSDRALGRSLAAAGERQAAAEYSVEAMVASYQRLYDELLPLS